MKKKRIGGAFLAIVAGAGVIIGSLQTPKSADAAILVHDENNILQNIKVALNTATTAANTARQVALEIQMLKSMSPEGLMAHYLGLTADLNNVLDTIHSYQGIMNTAKTAQSAWSETFQSVNNIFDGNYFSSKHYKNNQNSIMKLETAYRDSITAAKNISNIEERSKQLKETVIRSANASGTKEAIQADTQIAAMVVEETMKSNQLLAQNIAITASRAAKENQDEAAAIAINNNSAKEFQTHVENLKIYQPQTTYDAAVKMYGSKLAKYYQ